MNQAEHDAARAEPPLVLDLDGTLLRTDVLVELFARRLRASPLRAVLTVGALVGGKAALKRAVTQGATLDVGRLPWDDEVIAFARAERARGRRVVLATAADEIVAREVAAHLDLFDEVIASDGVRNLRADQKAQELTTRFGDKGFDYAGDALVDVPVWRVAREALLVGSASTARAAARQGIRFSKTFSRESSRVRALLKAMRPSQWTKNALLFVPLALAHKVQDPPRLGAVLAAFVAMSLCASAIYLVNDVVDVEADRGHHRKKSRPFAAGSLPLAFGLVAPPILIAIGVGLAIALSPGVLGLLLTYLVVTTAYSFWGKARAVYDVLMLAGLYWLRIVAGGAAADVPISTWMGTFSLFFFFSLAASKRVAELVKTPDKAPEGRGYRSEDRFVMASFGVAAGFVAVMVAGLYFTSRDVERLYAHPTWLWGILPVMLAWVSRVWLLATRGEMPDDPVLFALKDRESWIMLLVCVGIVVAAV